MHSWFKVRGSDLVRLVQVFSSQVFHDWESPSSSYPKWRRGGALWPQVTLPEPSLFHTKLWSCFQGQAGLSFVWPAECLLPPPHHLHSSCEGAQAGPQRVSFIIESPSTFGIPGFHLWDPQRSEAEGRRGHRMEGQIESPRPTLHMHTAGTDLGPSL